MSSIRGIQIKRHALDTKEKKECSCKSEFIFFQDLTLNRRAVFLCWCPRGSDFGSEPYFICLGLISISAQRELPAHHKTVAKYPNLLCGQEFNLQNQDSICPCPFYPDSQKIGRVWRRKDRPRTLDNIQVWNTNSQESRKVVSPHSN